jgi:putative transposase
MKASSIEEQFELDLARANQARPAGATPIPMLSKSTIRRRVESTLSPFELVEAKEGRKAAERFANATGGRIGIDTPGAITEFDDMDAKVFCVSERTGLGWGRPFITYGVDQSSAYPVGRSFGRHARSAASAVDCVVNAASTKPVITTAAGKTLEWTAKGFCTQAVFDNALYNNERIVTLGADVCDAAWARPYQPTDKREVEYLNGRTRRWLEEQPGYRGPKDDVEALKHGLGTAIFTFEELSSRHLIWLVGAYSNKPMGDGLSRKQKYEEQGRLQLRPRYPVDERRLRALRMVPLAKELTWTRNGLKYANLLYQDESMFRLLVRRPGRMKVRIRIDPECLWVLYVEAPDGMLLEVPCINQQYAAGLNHYQHKQILKICKEQKKRNPDLPILHAALEELRNHTAQWCTSGKVRERKKAERTGELPAKPKVEAVHDLELGYDSIAAIEMDADDEGYVIPEV